MLKNGLKKEIVALYRQGHSQGAIAKLINRPRQTVAYHLYASGVLTDAKKYEGVCCICGVKTEPGVPVCMRGACINYWTDSEECNPTSEVDLHLMKLSAPAEVEFPDTAVFCKFDPGCKRVFAHQADHIRFHYYRRSLNDRLRAPFKAPQPIYYSGQSPKANRSESAPGKIKSVYLRREFPSDARQLRHLREARNTSQRELAHLAQVSVATICNYESGKRVPSVYNAIRIADALRVQVKDIWRER